MGLGFPLQEAVVGLKGLVLGEQPMEDLGPEFVAVLKRENGGYVDSRETGSR